MKSGKHEGYYWLVSSEALRGLEELVIFHHKGMVLAITCFDSGPLKPTEDEIMIGWDYKKDVLYSPPLITGLDIPNDQYDEWYIGVNLEIPDSEMEIFVNYGGFSVTPLNESPEVSDSSWERDSMEFLEPIQHRFWAQIKRIDPVTYVALGDNDVVVSKNKQFIDAVVGKCANKSYGIA